MTDDGVEGRRQGLKAAFGQPLIQFLEAAPVDFSDPAAGLVATVTGQAVNGAGFLHGGAIAALLELAAWMALYPTLDATESATTHAFSATYVEPAQLGQEVHAVGSVIRRGRRLAFVTASMTASGRTVATALVTKSIAPH